MVDNIDRDMLIKQVNIFIKYKGDCSGMYILCYKCIVKSVCKRPYNSDIRYKKAIEIGIAEGIITEEEVFEVLL